MRQNLDLDAIGRDAARSARRDFAEGALPVPPLPERCPFALEELLDEDASPRDLAPRIARGCQPVDEIVVHRSGSGAKLTARAAV